MMRQHESVGEYVVTLYCNHPEEDKRDMIRKNKSVGECGVTLYCNHHEVDKRT